MGNEEEWGGGQVDGADFEFDDGYNASLDIQNLVAENKILKDEIKHVAEYSDCSASMIRARRLLKELANEV